MFYSSLSNQLKVILLALPFRRRCGVFVDLEFNLSLWLVGDRCFRSGAKLEDRLGNRDVLRLGIGPGVLSFHGPRSPLDLCLDAGPSFDGRLGHLLRLNGCLKFVVGRNQAVAVGRQTKATVRFDQRQRSNVASASQFKQNLLRSKDTHYPTTLQSESQDLHLWAEGW